ncbi:MAG: hypothetical protein U0R64_04260 [Candidatus Nanopelagicales bacterium]
MTDSGPFRLRASCDCPYSRAGRLVQHAIAVTYAVAALDGRGRVIDETGRLGGALQTVDRADLEQAAAVLVDQPAIEPVVDPDAIYAEVIRWLPSPLRATDRSGDVGV